MTEEKRAELLMDHYKDTAGIAGGHFKARNRLFMFTLILLGLLILDGLSPGTLPDMVNGYLRHEYVQPDKGESWVGLDFAAVDFTARFILLWLAIGYFQRSLVVHRLYKYLHSLEERICVLSGEDSFTREGKAYFSRSGVPEASQEGDPAAQPQADPAIEFRDHRPSFLRWVAPLYHYIFPVGLSVLAVWRLYVQDVSWDMSVIDVLNALCSLGILFYSISYVRWIRWGR